MAATDLHAWATAQAARFRSAAATLKRKTLHTAATHLVTELRRASPRRTGRLARSWRIVESDDTVSILGAPYARKVDEGVPSVAKRALGMIVPLRGTARGIEQVRTGRLVTIPFRRGGIVALILTRKSRRLVAVRKMTVSPAARPYIADARRRWPGRMASEIGSDIREALLGRR